jgi:hypothetical protein
LLNVLTNCINGIWKNQFDGKDFIEMEEGEFQTIYNEVKDTALHKIKYM